MLWRLILQSWRHGLRRKLLAIATVFLAAALISALLAVAINSGDRLSHEMKSYGANILIEPAAQAVLPDFLGDGSSRSVHDYLDESELVNIKEIFWRNNILGFAPLLTGRVRHGEREVAIVGTWFDQPMPLEDDPAFRTGQQAVSLTWNVRGEWPRDDADEALAGRRMAEAAGWKTGDRIPLTGSHGTLTVRLAGIVESGGAEDDQLLLPLARAQFLLGLENKVQSVRVSAMTVPENRLSRRARIDPDKLDAKDYDRWFCTAYVSSIAHQLEETLSGVVVRPIWQVAASEGIVIGKIQLLLIVATLAALLAASMGIASLMTSTIMERSREIGLMKALAARDWQIMTLFHAEAALSGILGGAAGCLAGWLLARAIGRSLFGSPLGFPWIVVPGVLFVSLLIAFLGTWLPARRISGLNPADILYGRH